MSATLSVRPIVLSLFLAWSLLHFSVLLQVKYISGTCIIQLRIGIKATKSQLTI